MESSPIPAINCLSCDTGILRKTCVRSSDLTLLAQPEPVEYEVNEIRGFIYNPPLSSDYQIVYHFYCMR